jgi:hypothetical protein
MKLLILVLATVVCLPAFAAESVTTTASESKAALPAATSFCGQDVVRRLFMKTEVGQRLQLRQQEAQRDALRQAARQVIRQAMHEAMLKGEISVQEYMRWLEVEETSALITNQPPVGSSLQSNSPN